MKEATYTTDEGDEYTLEELKEMEEWWRDNMNEAAKKGDDWGYDMAREKWQDVQNAINELEEQIESEETVTVDGEEYTKSELQNIIEFWEEKSLESAKMGDDWGREMADEKMGKAQDALTTLQN